VFEQLDDPRPPQFGESFRSSVVRRARSRRRRRRLAGGAGALAAVLVVGAGGLYGRAAWRLNDLDRVDVAGTGPVAEGDPMTVLVVGTDTRPGQPSLNSDTVLLARLDPATGSAALLSLPRDLMVEAPGGGAPVMINSLVVDHGLGGLVAVVEGQIGIPVDHTVIVGMDGFRSLVDRIGGIEVWVERPLRDRNSGLHLDEPGCVALDGERALALVRSRKVEVMDASGAWVSDPLADVRRVATQRHVLLAALAGLRADGVDPVSVDRMAGWALEHVTVDEALDRDDVADLMQAALALDPGRLSQATLPVVPYPGDVNRLAADPVAAPAAVEAFLAGRTLADAGGDPVDVLSDPGSGLPGGAFVAGCPDAG
jgi:LCP family protein required for cell wall assembly